MSVAAGTVFTAVRGPSPWEGAGSNLIGMVCDFRTPIPSPSPWKGEGNKVSAAR